MVKGAVWYPEETSRPFWRSLIRAAEAEPQLATSIRGASGLDHPVLGVGLDESRARVLIICAETTARSAALVQQDVQRAVPHARVLAARPLLHNYLKAAETLGDVSTLSLESLRILDYSRWEPFYHELNERQYSNVVETAGVLEREMAWLRSGEGDYQGFWPGIISGKIFKSTDHLKSTLRPQQVDTIEDILATLLRDPAEQDVQLGLCPVPLYDFSPDESELLKSETDLNEIKRVLQTHGVLQFFFPAPDQLALGIIERSQSGADAVIERVLSAPGQGHPFGSAEFIASSRHVLEVVEQLTAQGLAVEGEVDVHLTPDGQSVRQTVKFKPQESVVSKLINRVTVSLNLKDLFGLK